MDAEANQSGHAAVRNCRSELNCDTVARIIHL